MSLHETSSDFRLSVWIIPGLFLLGFPLLSWGCVSTREGMTQETGTHVTTTIQGPGGGGEVQYWSEVSKGVHSLDGSPEEVWPLLRGVLEELGIPVGLLDPTTRTIGNPRFRPQRIGKARNSRYFDCGHGVTAVPYADQYELTASVMAHVGTGDDGNARLETVVTGSARSRALSGGAINCTSKGTLERAIADLVGEGLKG